jgi:hypothetical protein
MPKLNAGAGATAPARRAKKPTAAEILDVTPEVYPRVGDMDLSVLSVDPGTTHVGVVVGCRYDQAPGWRVYSVAEMLPDDFAAWVFPRLGMFDVIGCEDFVVYANKARELIGSRLETVRLLGWLEFTVKEWNRRPLDPEHRKAGPYDIQWFSHMAQIHKGTEAVMKHAGIPFVSPATPDHARSAELHFWHFLIRNGLVDGVELA